MEGILIWGLVCTLVLFVPVLVVFLLRVADTIGKRKGPDDFSKQVSENIEQVCERIERLEERMANIETIVLEKEKEKRFDSLVS